MTFTKTNHDFFITPFIDIPSFKNKTQFLNLVETEMQVLESNLKELDIYTFLKDVYKLGQTSFKEIINAKRNNQDYLEIHCRQVGWICNYFYYLGEINKKKYFVSVLSSFKSTSIRSGRWRTFWKRESNQCMYS